jgi:hypothetical protein
MMGMARRVEFSTMDGTAMTGQLETGREFFIGPLQLNFFTYSREYSCRPLLLSGGAELEDRCPSRSGQ